MHFTEEQWDIAYTWLCKQRRNYPVNSDIWHLRFNWVKEKYQLVNELRFDRYQFSPLQCITKKNGEVIHIWSSEIRKTSR